MKDKAKEHKEARIDFVTEVVKFDKKTGIVTMSMTPDPARYSRVEHDGKAHYLDKHLRILIDAEELMAGLVKGLPGTPAYYSPPSIKNSLAYAAQRLRAVSSELKTGIYVPPAEAARPHGEFSASSQERNIAFISIDICGATAYRKNDEAGFDKVCKIFFQELGTLVGQFHGRILKTTGDGFIAYVDGPGFTTQCDNAVDLGLSLLLLVENTINPALALENLSPISVRVGAEYGAARLRKLYVTATGYSDLDVSSDALNRAVKIQESCGASEFRIGRELYELLHVRWLERAVQVPFEGRIVGIENYKVYKVN